MEWYVIISADCHAGPDSPAYREFLDPEYRAEFDYELEAAGRPWLTGQEAVPVPAV